MNAMPTVPELLAELERVRQNEARYRLLLEHSGEVGWIADCASGRLTYLSPAAGRLFGHDLDSAQPLAQALLRDLPARLARYRAGDASRRSVLRESELPQRDGRLIAVEIESTLISDADGTPATLLGVVRDISARREHAAQQKKFASMVSHEFRTPLSTIDGAVQRLEMTGAGHDEGTRKRYRKIQVAVDRMVALLETAAAQVRARRANITVRTAGLPQWLRCDPNGMRLALDILLDNAIKYTPDGSAIELLGNNAQEGGIEFRVRDHGAGIPDEELDQVFDKSYRGRNAGNVAGSGLGLYMARAVVEVHGGILSVKNVSESGTEFRIWLPWQGAAGKSLAPDGCSSDNSLTQAD